MIFKLNIIHLNKPSCFKRLKSHLINCKWNTTSIQVLNEVEKKI